MSVGELGCFLLVCGKSYWHKGAVQGLEVSPAFGELVR